MSRFFFVAGALCAALAVALGAFGAHGLEGRITPERLQTFETAVRYQMYHALALLVLGWVTTLRGERWIHWAGFLFIAGILLFSGSLYLLVLTNTTWLGAITPFGGVAFITGWILFAGGFARSR